MDKLESFKQYISNFIGGTNVDAILSAFADEDDKMDELTIAVNNQLRLSTSSGVYLDKKAADYGIVRPAELGMEDLAFRNMTIQINSAKQITEIIHTVLATFYSDEAVRAYAQSTVQEPYQLANGMDLRFTLEDGVERVLVVQTSDFADINNATAKEICDAITKFISALGFDGYGQSYLDVDTQKTYVRVYGGAKGPYGAVTVAGGEIQSVLQFPLMRGTELPISDTIYEITKTVGSILRFRWTGVGSMPALDKVFIGDRILLYGQQFKNLNLYGTYTVTDVRPAAAPPNHGYQDGWFEIEKSDFIGLTSSPPNTMPPVNQPASSWSSITAYQPGQIVTYGLSNYEALQATTNNQPDTSPLFWSTTAKTGIFYTITVSLVSESDMRFFYTKKNTPYQQARYALAFEPSDNLLKIYMPATTKVVKRDLVGSAHLHLLYPAGNLNGAFGSNTDTEKKVQVLNERTIRYAQGGYDNYGVNGNITYTGGPISGVPVDYATRESGYTTITCLEPHGIVGVLDQYNRTLSNSIVTVAIESVAEDDQANPFLGPYMVDTEAGYDLTDTYVTTRERVLAGDIKNTLYCKGNLPNSRGMLLLDLNKDTQEGPLTYYSSQLINAPSAVDISAISQNATNVTVTTVSPHGAIEGSTVIIAGTVNFNGVYVVSTTPSTVTYVFSRVPPQIVAETNVGTSSTYIDGVASTITVDPSYRFKYNHDTLTDMTLLAADRAYVPDVSGSDYGFYITGTVDGRVFAQKLIQDITALGIALEIIIVYPSDVGLGNEGGSGDANSSPISDKVYVWGV